MGDFYVGQIVFLSGNTIPGGLVECDGRQMAIQKNQVLYSLLGTRFGGDGKTTFNLPDLRGRTPLGSGTNPHSGIAYTIGTAGGEETVTLTQETVPSHGHVLTGSSKPGTVGYPGNVISTVADSGHGVYPVYADGTASNASNLVALSGGNIASAGASGAHTNMQPYLTIRACIVTNGLYPPRP